MRCHRIALLGVLWLLTACRATTPPPAAPAEHPLLGTAWRVQDIDERPTLAEAASTLVIESRERVSGEGGCNRYFGGIGLDGSSMAFSQMGSTRMACPAPQMDQEQRFLSALQRVAYWELRGDALLLLDGQGQQRLRLARMTGASGAAGDTLVVAAPTAPGVFQGIGHEPGWTLEIRPDVMELVTGYGTQRVSAPTPEPRAEGAGDTTYAAATDAHRLTVRIRAEPCRDSMSGLGYPATVEAVLDGKTLRGCGRWSR